MVIAVTPTHLVTYDPTIQRFVDLAVPDTLRAEVCAAADLIRRGMLDDDIALLIARETPKTAQIAAQTL